MSIKVWKIIVFFSVSQGGLQYVFAAPFGRSLFIPDPWFWFRDPWSWSQGVLALWSLTLITMKTGRHLCCTTAAEYLYSWPLILGYIPDPWFLVYDPWSWSQGRLWDICAAPLLRWGLSVQLPSQPAVVNAAENQKSNLKLAWDQMKDVIRDMRKIEKNVHTEKLGLHITWVTYIVNRILYEDLNNFGARFIS